MFPTVADVNTNSNLLIKQLYSILTVAFYKINIQSKDFNERH